MASDDDGAPKNAGPEQPAAGDRERQPSGVPPEAESAGAVAAGGGGVDGGSDGGGSADIGSLDSDESGEDMDEEDDDEGMEDWFSGDEEEGDEEGSGEEWTEDEDSDDEDAEDGWWGWGDGGGADSESSEEPGAEEEAAARLAAETAGRHVLPSWAAYAVPTSSSHFQSADALSVVELAPSSAVGRAAGRGGLLLATVDAEGVAAWVLPAAGGMESAGCWSQPQAVRLGGMQSVSDVYSMALSPDGRYIATGGDGGLLALYSVDPSATPRPGMFKSPDLIHAEQLFYYTPPLMDVLARAMFPNFQSGMEQLVQLHAQLQAQRQQQQEQQQAPQQEHQQQAQPQALEGVGNLMSFDELMQGLLGVPDGPPLAAAARTGPGQFGLPATDVLASMTQRMKEAFFEAGFTREQMDEAIADTEARMAAIKASGSHQAPPAATASAAAASGAAASGAADAAADESATAPEAGLEDPKGKRPVAEGQAERAPGARGSKGRHAAVMLRWMAALGMGEVQAHVMPNRRDGMVNGVRFGLVAGKHRLLAADQSGYVYVFELPPAPPLAPKSGSSNAAAGSSSTHAASQAASSGRPGDLQPEQLLCQGLGSESPHWCMRPVNCFGFKQHDMGAEPVRQLPTPRQPRPMVLREGDDSDLRLEPGLGTAVVNVPPKSFVTAAIGPLPWPCNLAVPSPDGRWIAVVGDRQCVALVDQQAGFEVRLLHYDLVGSRDRVRQDIEAGSQYAAWNASSSLLAVTSDALHAVFVFEPASGAMVLRVEGHRRPCLGVEFAPWDDRLLVYAEETRQVHLRRVPDQSSPAGSASKGGGAAAAATQAVCTEQSAQDDLADARLDTQLLRLPLLPAPPPSTAYLAGATTRRRHIHGLALTAAGDLLVASKQGAVLRFLASRPWAPEQHKNWPQAFRAQARELLLCAHRRQQHNGAAAAVGLWSLPQPLLHHIISLMAGRRLDWLPQASPAAGAGAVGAGDGV